MNDLVIGKNVEKIAEYAFWGCKNLTEVTIPDGVTAIESDSFQGCSRLENIAFSNSLNKIGRFAFSGCTALNNIVLPDSLETIDSRAFHGCSNLTSLYIPKNVTYVGGGIVSGCNKVTSLSVDRENKIYSSANNCIIEKETKKVISGCIESVIPDDGSVLGIGTYSFSGFNFSSFIIPIGIKYIESDAFSSCPKLESVSIPYSVNVIGENAFYNCQNLKTVVISQGTVSIEQNAFSSNLKMDEVTLPKSVTNIGLYSFNCSNLQKITILNPECSIADNELTIGPAAAIYGYKDSTAQAYAEKYGRVFVSICDHENASVSDVSDPTCTTQGSKTYDCPDCENVFTAYANPLGHDYISEIKTQVSCTETGEIVYTCSRCNDTYSVEVLPEHKYELTISGATCTENGYEKYECSICNDIQITEIPASHNYETITVVKATSEEDGSVLYRCSRCGDEYSLTIPKSYAIGILVIQDILPWTSDSNTKVLNDLLSDEYIGGWDMTSTNNLENVNFNEYDEIYIANDQPTETYNRLAPYMDELVDFSRRGGTLIIGACDKGWAEGDMSSCLPLGITLTTNYAMRNYVANRSHNIVTGLRTFNGEINNSYLYGRYCSHGSFDNLPSGTNVIITDAYGKATLCEFEEGEGKIILSSLTWEYSYDRLHENMPTNFSKNCYDDLFLMGKATTNVEEEPEHIHSYIDKVKEPSCVEGGFTTHTCILCGYSYNSDFVSSAGHIEAEAVRENINEATCTEDGDCDKVIYCKACFKELSREYTVIPAHGHNYKSIVTHPTCTDNGYTMFVCQSCGDSFIDDEVAATNHTPGQTYKINRTDSSCITKGGYDLVTYCANCGKELSREHFETDAKGHTPVKINAVPATATQNGYTGDIVCSDCGIVIEKGAILPIGSTLKPEEYPDFNSGDFEHRNNGNNWDFWYENETFVNGTMFRVEEVYSGDDYDSCADKNKKHKFKMYDLSAQVGEMSVQPNGDIWIALPLPGNFDENKTVIYYVNGDTYESIPCCVKDGKIYFRTNHFSSYAIVDLSEHQHVFSSVVTQKTCTTDGYTTYTCLDCDYSYKGDFVKADHSFINTVIAPTCTEKGYTSHICLECGYSENDNYVNAAGHTEDSTGKCINCGKDLQAEREENCSCSCHNDGFSGFIWKILRIFYKIFKVNKVCACGKAHY
ncbi:MAG: leucine-rich repeat domain-containing protein [Acutalibacteraceae bacterium]